MANIPEMKAAGADPASPSPSNNQLPGLTVKEHIAVEMMKARRMADAETAAATVATDAVTDANALIAALRPA